MAESGPGGRGSLERLLDCIAVTPELDGLLVYDASAGQLEWIAELLEVRLAAIGPRVDRVRLGAAQGDSELWGSGHGLPEAWRRCGLLRAREDVQQIVIAPDLARLSVPAARAAVALLDAPVVHLEREGESIVLVPRARQRWLAGLAEENAGEVSPHLLDRFAVQVRIGSAAAEDVQLRAARMEAELAGRSRAQPSLGPVEYAHLRAAAARLIDVAPAAAEQALAITAEGGRGLRRPIALLRLAGGLARLDQADRVEPAHVREAAALIGLAADAADERGSSSSANASPAAASSIAALEPALARAEEAPGLRHVTPVQPEAASPDTEALFSKVAEGDAVIEAEHALAHVELGPAPLPGDAPIRRDHTPLRLPWQRSGGRARGPAIGARRTTSIDDLAVSATLLAAAPFQPHRRAELGRRRSQELLLRRADLRAYRRAPFADELLVLLIDYTSVTRRDWQPAIVPFLASAYTARAEIALVTVGAHRPGEADALRADRITARSILVPAIAAALDLPAARATPLAHGLELARRTLVDALSHGRSAVRRATLVVLTDGRGNVPLDLSRGSTWSGSVGPRGIEDARRCARAIRTLTHVRCVLIDPRPRHLPDLPHSLAAALGAEVISLEAGDLA